MDEAKPFNATAEHREPCDSRGSCTVLGAPGGEIPSGDSTPAAVLIIPGLGQVGLTQPTYRRIVTRCRSVPTPDIERTTWRRSVIRCKTARLSLPKPRRKALHPPPLAELGAVRLLKDELEACRVTSDRGEIVHKNQSSIGSSVMRFRPQLAGNADQGAVAAAFPEGSWSASDREAVQRTPR